MTVPLGKLWRLDLEDLPDQRWDSTKLANVNITYGGTFEGKVFGDDRTDALPAASSTPLLG